MGAARLMYPQHPDARFARFRYGRLLDWREGGTSWTQDYPRADRHFALALRRLTRIDVRSRGTAEQSRRRRRLLQLAVAVAGRDGRLEVTDAQGRSCASTCCAAASSCWTISGAPDE